MTKAEDSEAGICVTIRLMPRPDGGLRVSSDTLPGLFLSGADPDEVALDIGPAILALLKHAAQQPDQPSEGEGPDDAAR